MAIGATSAVAAGELATGSTSFVVKRHEVTVSVLPARITTVNVVYPDALKFGGARYSSKVRILGPNPKVGGDRPRLGLIEVLSKRSAEGGSVLRVRISNRNRLGTLSARAEITAITREPRKG
ncbi:MAG: hypothetical protein ACYC91_11350 [Solirubrobacteraceae bacterium]